MTLLMVAACHRHGDLQRKQQQYDVVQEGQGEATSTINGPGEMPPPPTTTAMTDTSVDTTSNFSLPNAAPAPGTTTGNLAGTMIVPPPKPRSRKASPPPAPATDTASAEPTDTTTTAQPPPTQTDTSGKPPS